MFSWLGRQSGSYLLSLNGHVGGVDRTLVVPGDLYDEHVQVEAGDNRLQRLTGHDRPSITDSLYIRRVEDGRAASGPLDHPGGRRIRGICPQLPREVRDTADGLPKARPHSEGMSAAIRSLLDAEPDIKPAEVKRRLAVRGMTVTSTLFRVVRLGWRRARASASLDRDVRSLKPKAPERMAGSRTGEGTRNGR